MRSLLLPVAVLAVVAGGPVWAEGEKRYDPRRVAALIEQLGDWQFQTREAAEKGLVDIGEPALAGVRTTLRTTDVPEIGRRAERVERAILWKACQSQACGLRLMPADPGEYEMGSPGREPGRRDDEPQHTVRITRLFLIGKHEVTQAEYKKVTGVNPSYFIPTGEGKAKVKDLNTDRLPVEQVSWYDAVTFCNKLSLADGHPAYYQLTEWKSDGDSISSATVKVLGGPGYRLPTEAEWEYAARAATGTPYANPPTPQGNIGNFKRMVSVGYGGSEERGSLGRPAAVGSYKPNKLGLYDVHGNAAEWCHDWYGKRYYADAPPDDPPGPETGDHKVIRGGSWMSMDGGCRSAARFYLTPGERKDYVGFRVARTP
jgi:formylglycine-generating enzyme required for sulfatase activity